jgi:hypothetical protein
MAIWIVRATWIEDEDEVSERWEVNAATAHEAVEDVTAHIRFAPHHVGVRMRRLRATFVRGRRDVCRPSERMKADEHP